MLPIQFSIPMPIDRIWKTFVERPPQQEDWRVARAIARQRRQSWQQRLGLSIE